MKKLALLGVMMSFGPRALADTRQVQKKAKEIHCTVYRAVNGTPAGNLEKVIELMGGIETIIGEADVVFIKPNLQWWNQGAPNLSAFQTFVDLTMNRPGGFKGEIVIVENVHRGSEPWHSLLSGWARRFERNSDIMNVFSYNELGKRLKKQYGERFSVRHLINIDIGGKRVYGPDDGQGYVYCDGTSGVPLISFDNGRRGADFRSVIMTYPIIRTDKGTIIDFKNGIWEKGEYTDQTFKFINFSALNHHSPYCGATSAIKNYLGISDLSGGPDPNEGGRLTNEYYNFHSFPFNKWEPGPVAGMIGAEIGMFMNTIRKADLNITTAEWVGLASRTDPPVAHTRVVLASKDPVALDYHAFKYVLFPNSRVPVHNPDNENSPVFQYLEKCEKHGGGVFREEYVQVKDYDFRTNSVRDENNQVVLGKIEWGTNLKMILKYLLLRFGLGSFFVKN